MVVWEDSYYRQTTLPSLFSGSKKREETDFDRLARVLQEISELRAIYINTIFDFDKSLMYLIFRGDVSKVAEKMKDLESPAFSLCLEDPFCATKGGSLSEKAIFSLKVRLDVDTSIKRYVPKKKIQLPPEPPEEIIGPEKPEPVPIEEEEEEPKKVESKKKGEKQKETPDEHRFKPA